MEWLIIVVCDIFVISNIENSKRSSSNIISDIVNNLMVATMSKVVYDNLSFLSSVYF